MLRRYASVGAMLALVTASCASGPPTVTGFHAPETFECMLAYPNQSQVTLGWSAPDATDVEFTLDGQALPVGIRDVLPYQVPAGDATGIGATIVFDCMKAPERTIEAVWTTDGSAATREVVTVRRGEGSAS